MKSHGSRKFYHLPDSLLLSECGSEEPTLQAGRSTKKFRSKSAHFRGSTRDLMQMIDHNVIGRDTTFQGPFGPRKSVYMDHAASGQPLRCIENFIQENVLPYYGNTHTTTTLTSSQTTMYRHEAKDIIRNSVGASEHDVVIFCGSGATGAVHKLVQALTGDNSKPLPVVFTGPFEHHSSLLPWRDVGATIISVPETKEGNFHIDFLETKLKEVSGDERNKGRLLIGCFSAASNITGMVTDDVAVTMLLHKYGGLALWDYSAVAAHVQVVMNAVPLELDEHGLARKDALYFSGHKFVGGPQTPGVLVAKKSIFDNSCIPHGAGGGSVFFVTGDSHRYLKNAEFREEGGTPAIVESIRLGLVFRLKDTVGSTNIVSQEAMITKKILEEWKHTPEIKILGSIDQPRLPIISLLIQNSESGFYLHHNYVVALLNDLFGIQSRGGCACAGMYAQELLGINLNLAHDYEKLLLEDSRLDRNHLRRCMEGSPYEIFRPGFSRISIPFYSPLAEVDFVIEAVQLIAKHGWKLLPLYSFNPETGEFHHHANHMLHHRKWLSWACFSSEGIRCKERVRNNSEDCINYKECLEQAKNILTNAHNMSKRRSLPDQTILFDSKYAHLRWFLLPSEAQTLLNSTGSVAVISPRPFVAKEYVRKKDEEAQSDDGVPTVALSIPKQLLKSCWSWKGNLRISANRKDVPEFFHENSTESELNISSNESDSEYLVPGTTVVGPSICFSVSAGTDRNLSPAISRLGSVSDEPLLDPGLSVDRKEESQESVSRSLVSCSSPLIISENSLNDVIAEGFSKRREDRQSETTMHVVREAQGHHHDVGVGSVPPHQSLQYASLHQSSMTVDGTAYPSPSNGLPVAPPTYSPSGKPLRTSLSLDVPSVSCIEDFDPSCTTSIASNFYINCSPTLSSHLNNVSPVPCTDTFSPGIPQYTGNYEQTANLNVSKTQQCNADIDIPEQLHTPMYSSCSPIPNYYEYNAMSIGMSPGSENCGGNCSSAVQSHTFAAAQWQDGLCNNLSPSSPELPRLLASPLAKPNGSLELEQSTDGKVTDAVRRVTNQLANELKSEIREVISQVEHSMDPEGVKERANSFSARDKPDDKKYRPKPLSSKLFCGRIPNTGMRSRNDSCDSYPGLTHALNDTTSTGLFSDGLNDIVTPGELDGIPGAPRSSKDLSPPDSHLCDKAGQSTDVTDKVNDTISVLAPDNQYGKSSFGTSAKWHCPSKIILKTTLQALSDFYMLKDGDRVLVCLSGGKDSLSLLHTMKQVQYNLAKQSINFSFGAVTVDPGSSSYNPRPLIPYLKALDVPYFYEEQGIMDTALDKGSDEVASICSFCSRMKRGRIYACARRNGYNVIALGQHLDDLAESFFISIFHNGLLRTMKAAYTVKEEDLRVIRPFVNTREKDLRDFAEHNGLPIIPENCPACFDAPTERHRIKQLLAQQEILFPRIYSSLRSALVPLMAVRETGLESKKNIGQVLFPETCNVEDDDL